MVDIVENKQAARPKVFALSQRFHFSQRRQETILAYACLAPWIFGFLVFTAGAMLYSLFLSFTYSDMLTGTRFVGLANFRLGEKGDINRILDAVRFNEQCIAIPGPYQSRAKTNLAHIRKNYRIER